MSRVTNSRVRGRWSFDRAVLATTIALNLQLTDVALIPAQNPGGPRPDTTIIDVGAPVYPGVATLEAELTIGTEVGPIEYSFGRITDLLVSQEGDIYVVDAPIRVTPVVRRYDSRGVFVREIGRAGAGPGEYGTPNGMVFAPDGRLLLYDLQHSRINVYSPAGDPIDTWSIPPYRSLVLSLVPRLFNDRDLYLIRFNPITTLPRTPNALSSVPSALVRLRDGGRVVDTVFTPRLPDVELTMRVRGRAGMPPDTVRLPYSPKSLEVWSPLGYWVTAQTNRYAIDLRVGGDSAVISFRRDVETVPISRDERADQRELLELQVAGGRGGASVPEIPRWKPILRGIRIGADGRIWVQVSQPSQRITVPAGRSSPAARWSEPSVYDVLEPDGRYLGAVRIPDGLLSMEMRGEHVWGVIRNERDVPFVRRYRIAWRKPEPH